MLPWIKFQQKLMGFKFCLELKNPWEFLGENSKISIKIEKVKSHGIHSGHNSRDVTVIVFCLLCLR